MKGQRLLPLLYRTGRRRNVAHGDPEKQAWKNGQENDSGTAIYFLYLMKFFFPPLSTIPKVLIRVDVHGNARYAAEYSWNVAILSIFVVVFVATDDDTWEKNKHERGGDETVFCRAWRRKG